VATLEEALNDLSEGFAQRLASPAVSSSERQAFLLEARLFRQRYLQSSGSATEATDIQRISKTAELHGQ
jgi:hypothetical protein